MSAAQSTPGPWVVHPIHARVECQQFSKKGGLLPVCELLWPTDERSEAETEANARLIASAPDHALIGWAMCVQDATWEEWGDGKGEFCFAGLRHATTLDGFGCPVLTDNLRALIAKAAGQ